MKISDILHQKLTPSFYFSAGFFLLCMSLDYYLTYSISGGDPSMEASILAGWWWKVTGPFRYTEIPLYAIGIIGTAFIINYKSRSFTLFWLNLLAFNHLFGFLSWIPAVNLNFIYSLAQSDWGIGYVFSLFSAALSLPLTLLQLRFQKSQNPLR
jgi:hypothetical protein